MRQYNDPNESQNQSTEAPSLTWMDACLLLIQSPRIETFKTVLTDKKLTAHRAFFWVFLAGISFGLALAPNYPFGEMVPILVLGIPGVEAQASAYHPSWFTIILVSIIVGGMYSVIGFIVQTWLLQHVGKIFKAQGSYHDMFVLRGIYYPILLVMRSISVAAFGATSPFAIILIFGTLFLDLLLSSLAMSAANNLTWRQGLMIVTWMNAGLFIGLFLIASISLIGG